MSAKKIKTRNDFDAELGAGGKRFILFYSAWCPFCSSFLPAFEDQAKSAPGTWLKACTDDLPDLEERFSIEVVPTVLCFVDGKLADRLDGQLGRGLSAEGLRAFAGNRGGAGGERP